MYSIPLCIFRKNITSFLKFVLFFKGWTHWVQSIAVKATGGLAARFCLLTAFTHLLSLGNSPWESLSFTYRVHKDACLTTACVTVSLNPESIPLQLKTALIKPQLVGGKIKKAEKAQQSSSKDRTTHVMADHKAWRIIFKTFRLSCLIAFLQGWGLLRQ